MLSVVWHLPFYKQTHFLCVQSSSFPSLSIESRVRKVKVKVTLPPHLQRGLSTREKWKKFLLVSVKRIFHENLLHKLLTFALTLVVYYVEVYLFIYLFCFQPRSR